MIAAGGLVLLGFGGALLWATLPKQGKTAPLVAKEPMSWLGPLLVTSAFAVGLALVVKGLV